MAKPRMPKIRPEAFAAGTAAIVSVAALFVAWDQARIARTEVRAAIWPALQIDGFVSREPGGLEAGFRVQNAGVGPALVKRVTLSHGGTVLESYDDLADYAPEGYNLSFETLTGRILAADQESRPIRFYYPASRADEASELFAERGDDWVLDVCYCSVLDQCWTRRSDNDYPVDAPNCEGPRHGEF